MFNFRFENPSSENRELADIVRELGGLLPCGPEVDWQELRGRCGDVLRELTRGPEQSRRLTAIRRRISAQGSELGESWAGRRQQLRLDPTTLPGSGEGEVAGSGRDETSRE